MGLLARLVGGRTSEERVTEALVEALSGISGVPEGGAAWVRFNRQPDGGGAVSGIVHVADSATFLRVLRVSLDVVGRRAGDPRRVIFYLTGRTPDGEPVAPEDLGLGDKPTGNVLLSRLSNPG